MGLTTDRNDPALKTIKSDGQQEVYLVLSEEERAKGFVRPVRHKYRHLKCGVVTMMGDALSETYARDPKFYGGTFCCGCGTHLPLRTYEQRVSGASNWSYANSGIDGWQFLWEPGGDPVGSNAEEAEAFFAARQLEKPIETFLGGHKVGGEPQCDSETECNPPTPNPSYVERVESKAREVYMAWSECAPLAKLDEEACSTERHNFELLCRGMAELGVLLNTNAR